MSRAYDLIRPGARRRGYDRHWEAGARQFKQAHPFCLGCAAIGVNRATDVVDHIVPHRGNEMLLWDRNNWQPSCEWHHDAIKPILEREYRLGKIAAADLVLTSSRAVALTRAKHRPAIGADGYPIPGT